MLPLLLSFFFFNDTATTEIYTLSLHDALPISSANTASRWLARAASAAARRSAASASTRASGPARQRSSADRKSTRLNSSHLVISYAVFCLKKKNNAAQAQVTVTCEAPMRESDA